MSYVHPASDGLRKFIRSLGLNMQSYQLRQVSDESDLIDALNSVKYFFHSSISLHGSLTAAAIDDIRKDTEEYLLKGTTEQESTLKWFRNAAMYVLVVEPTITILCELTSDTLNQADNVIDTVINMVKTADVYGDHDDAIVAREQIRHIIAKYREAHSPKTSGKRPKKSKKKYTGFDYNEQDNEPFDKYNIDDAIEALDFN